MRSWSETDGWKPTRADPACRQPQQACHNMRIPSADKHTAGSCTMLYHASLAAQHLGPLRGHSMLMKERECSCVAALPPVRWALRAPLNTYELHQVEATCGWSPQHKLRRESQAVLRVQRVLACVLACTQRPNHTHILPYLRPCRSRRHAGTATGTVGQRMVSGPGSAGLHQVVSCCYTCAVAR